MKQHQNFKNSAILRHVFNLLLLELDVKIFYLKLQKYNNSEILMLLQKYIEIIMRGVHSNNIYLSSKLLKADCYTLKRRSCIRYTYKQTLITYLHYIRLIDKAPHRNPSLNVSQSLCVFFASLFIHMYQVFIFNPFNIYESKYLLPMQCLSYYLPNIVIWHVCLRLKAHLL